LKEAYKKSKKMFSLTLPYTSRSLTKWWWNVIEQNWNVFWAQKIQIAMFW